MEENAHQNPEESNRANQHRVTNFYIDNILRPDFGRNNKEGSRTRQRDRLEPILRTPELTGTRGSKPGDPRREAAGGGDTEGPEGADGAPKDREELSDRPRASAGPRAKAMLWPAWVYCTRYSDRPSSGPRSRKVKKAAPLRREDKRPRTAFTTDQLLRLKTEFQNSRYLTEQRRQSLARDLGLNESQIKIWFQNKRAKIKKASGNANTLALHLMAQGLYDHSTVRESRSDLYDHSTVRESRSDLYDHSTVRESRSDLYDHSTVRESRSDLYDHSTVRESRSDLYDHSTVRESRSDLYDHSTVRESRSDLYDHSTVRESRSDLMESRSDLMESISDLRESRSDLRESRSDSD